MNKLLIPPSPNWYETKIMACAPDNTLIYGSRNDLVVIHPSSPDEPAKIKVMSHCHRDRIIGVDVYPFWGFATKLALTVGADKAINLIDLSCFSIRQTHSGHKTRSEKLIGATFAGPDRIISVSEDGFILIWKLVMDKLVSIKNLLGKSKVTCIAACPHDMYLIAFGLKKGGIVIADIRNSGSILYKLKGHDNHAILSLSWCPVPGNIFPEKEVKVTPVSEKLLKKDDQGTPNDTNVPNPQVTDENMKKKEIDSTGENIETENLDTVTTELCTSLDPPEQIEQTESNDKEVTTEQTESNDKEVTTEETESNDKEITTEQNEQTESNDEKVTDEFTRNSIQALMDLIKNDPTCGLTQRNGKIDEYCIEGFNEENEEGCNSRSKSPQYRCYSESEHRNPYLPKKEYLLASSARGGKTIMIWRAGTDGLKQVELQLPSFYRKNARFDQEMSWIALCWVTPKNLLSSSPRGDLLSWNFDEMLLNNNRSGAYKSRVIHGDHSKHVFAIAAPVKVQENEHCENWRDNRMSNVWTVGKDRLVLNSNLSVQREILAAYPTFAGNIYCLAPSVIFPNKIAIGTGDGSCRLWDLSRPHQQYISMISLCEKSSLKVVNLAWHPKKDTILAFGTLDGQVGLLDPCNASKGPTFLVQHSQGTIHRLDWGPLNGNLDQLALYAICGGKLIAYDSSQPLEAPTLFDICEYVSQLAWKPDYSMLAVSSRTGNILLLSQKYELLNTIYLKSKAVHWLTWHPTATVGDDDVSPYSNWLGIAAHEVIVYDCSLSSTSNSAERTVAIFNDHVKPVECLAWSPFEGGKLASASGDGTAQVWDVPMKKLLHSCFTPDNDPLMTVIWSPLNHDYIITGSRGCILQIWKLSENAPKGKPEVGKKKRPQSPFSWSKNHNFEHREEPTEEEGNCEKIEELQKPKAVQRKHVLSGLVAAQNRNMQHLLLEDCRRLFAMYYGKGASGEIQHQNGMSESDVHIDAINVFGDDKAVESIFEKEKAYYSKKRVQFASAHISLWQGDIGDSIRHAINTKSLNSWLVSMAPTVSHELYLEACEVYAKQLSNDIASNVYEVVSYYLACHKVEEAVNALCTSKQYLEAVALAKCRLTPSDPLINTVVERWAKHSFTTGCYEVAAQCYIYLRRPSDAAQALFARVDKSALEFCVELAEHCGNYDLLEACLFRLKSFENGDKQSDEEKPLPSRLELIVRNSGNTSSNEDTPDISESQTEQAAQNEQEVALRNNSIDSDKEIVSTNE